MQIFDGSPRQCGGTRQETVFSSQHMQAAGQFARVLFAMLLLASRGEVWAESSRSDALKADTAETARALVPLQHKPLFETYCQGCHGSDKQKGKFRLDDLSYSITDIQTAERWQKVLNVLNAGEMPPEDEKQPPAQLKTDLLDDLAHTMVRARKVLADQNGTPVIRRLNRREYGNTLRDLLGVDVNVTELPADSGAGGFDTVGANLFMSANQFEQYMGLAREALEEAAEWRASESVQQRVRIEAEETFGTIRKNFDDKHDALERAKQWVQQVDEAIANPQNAQVVGDLRAALKKEDLVRREWAKIPGAPAPEAFGFRTVENNADKALGALSFATSIGAGYMRPYYEAYFALPHLDAGAYITVGGGGDVPNDNLTLLVPYSWKSVVGDYVLRVRLGAAPGAPEARRFIEFGVDPRNGQVMSTHHITGSIAQPQILEIPVSITRRSLDRPNRTLFIREKGANDHFTVTRRVSGEARRRNGYGPEPILWVDWMELERIPDSRKGSARALDAMGLELADNPTPSMEQTRSGVERFCREAFRGLHPEPAYLDKLMGLYQTRISAGDKHGAALKTVLSVALSSPQFLYLAEPVVDGKRRLLTGWELASRLSYFLWGGPPDADLRALAANESLADPAVLVAQTARLLDDEKARRFTRPFVHQWLNLDRMDFFEVNRELHPRFDASTKKAAKQEVFETFELLMRENAGAGHLLHSPYAVLNPVMAHFYGVEGVEGDGFRQVRLPEGAERGGLLGMAAVLFMGGNGERTSPVERGAWVLRKLLNDPPPPAPANVPQLARLAGRVLTTRERLVVHQEDPQCASCHRKIDPVGYGLENFDAVGLWRTHDTYQLKDENGKPIKDASKTWAIEATEAFHKGPAFRDYHQLRDIVASRVDAFSRGLSIALIEYALGRPVGFRDDALVDAMMTRAKTKNYGLREFVYALVSSEEFRTK